LYAQSILPGEGWVHHNHLPYAREALNREWMKMAFYSQLVTLGLQVSFIQYDLIVLQKP
jgi:hypothetical protein